MMALTPDLDAFWPILQRAPPNADRRGDDVTKHTAKITENKPAKPFAEFPLFPHATRRWAKKIRGKLHYFGPWDNPQAALDRYLEHRDDLHAGRTPRLQGDVLTLRDLASQFVTAKQHQLDTGEITQRTFDDYHATCKRLLQALGKTRRVADLTPDDFVTLRKQLAGTRKLVALGNEVQRIRTVFKYAHDADLIDRPIRFGPTFKRPSKKALRKARQEKGPRMFEREHLQAMLDAAGVQLRAMILLGINCGFCNTDVASLPIAALDLEHGWIDYPRPKTGAQRRIPLWSESIEALEKVLAERPTPKDQADNGLVFITKYGKPWAKASADNPISKETAKLLKKLGIHRPGLNFYALRHTFEMIGGKSRDQVAVDHIMGHARDDMASVYRERISEERLKSVTESVRNWLFGSK